MIIENWCYVHENQFKKFKEIFHTDSSEECELYLNKMIIKSLKEQHIFYSNEQWDEPVQCDEEVASHAWVPITPKGSKAKLWLSFIRNQRDYPKWFGFFIHSTEDMLSEMMKRKHFIIGDIVFKSAFQGNKFLGKLKENVQEESWNYQNSSINFPILKSYLEHTFMKLKNENNIIFSHDGSQAIFNTGLLEKHLLLDTYILCDVKDYQIFSVKTKIYENPQIISEDNEIIRNSFNNQKPQLPTYFRTLDEIIFNPDLDIVINSTHIFFDRASRIPSDICKSQEEARELMQKMKGNESILKKLSRRNYKMVVPQYYFAEEKIQFLMPIYLGTRFDTKPDFALVLDLTQDSTGNRFYIGKTILTLEMAYQNARLISKPDNPWISSTTTKADKIQRHH